MVSKEIFDAAVKSGSLAALEALLDAGAQVDIRESEEAGGSLTLAAYGRCAPANESLVPTFALLCAHGADLNITSSHGESALSVSAHRARFDGVRFLLDQGADPTPLQWTPLMRAIALGSQEEVCSLLEERPVLKDRDAWRNTPWLLSVQTGDLNKMQLLLEAGADRTETGHMGRTPLHYAVETDRPDVLKWLVSAGFDVNAPDEWGETPLYVAAESGYADCVAALLDRGADPLRASNLGERPIQVTTDALVAHLLLAAGEELSLTTAEVRRKLTGMPGGDPRATLAQYLVGCEPEFGRSHPQRMENSFWRAMVQSGCAANRARTLFNDTGRYDRPVWCYERFGRTTTWLPDGRIIEIAGEHEDFYDPDFYIYNDVTVYDGKGGFTIWGYPEQVFPPTDFHSATLVGEFLYIIGCLGYPRQRKSGETPVFRLDCRTLRIEPIPTSGEKPGWISRHTARYDRETDRICIFGGEIVGKETVPNARSYALDLKTRRWSALE